MVLEGMDKIKETRSDYGRFDAWQKSLINVLDSRCKTGSIASINMRQNTSKNSDIPFTEYAVMYTHRHLSLLFSSLIANIAII